ncbi:PR domain zinc finger protein 5-like [Phlebotomus papatasi]|uniref:PR domain zinc finger protein 5-like n=1 Tax=Phlebotomus papatasi TaxID=29031 RepID=UPI0024841FDB|nr:PR domain zinc finger protein 5-like [Phlebotomus papatasi]XP_055710159.1 PR domain zinc finger protein 5-like [Phlebotomus papatasi]
MPEVKLELFSVKQRVFLVKHFYQSFGDYKSVKSDYEAFYGASQICQISEAAIVELIELFEDTGSVLKTIRMVPQVPQESQMEVRKKRKAEVGRQEEEAPAEVSLCREIKGEMAKVDDPLEDGDCYSRDECEEVGVEGKEQIVVPSIKEEFLDDVYENDEEEFAYDEGYYHPEEEENEVIENTRAEESRVETQSQKIKVVHVNRLLEERIEYADDDVQEIEAPEKSPDKHTCPKCDKKCRTLKGHKCFLMACTYCRMKFPRKDLHRHMMRNHRNKKLFNCEFCGKYFLRRDDLESHRRIHTKEKPFTCRVEGCTERFHWRTALRRHELAVHIKDSTEVFNCNFCPASYRLKEYVVSHMKRWHDYKDCNVDKKAEQEEYPGTDRRRWKKCPNCHEKCEDLMNHECPAAVQEAAPIVNNPTENVCEVCQMQFDRDEELQEHRIIHTKPRPFICGFDGCNKSFCWRQSLRRHEHTHRNDWNRFTCNYCHYFSYSQDFLNRHLEQVHKISHEFPENFMQPNPSIHIPEIPQIYQEEGDFQQSYEAPSEIPEIPELLTCVHCQENFPKDELLHHITTEHSMKHYCEVCGKTFRRLQNFRNHQELHIQQQKLWICGTCGKTCLRKYDLKSHERVHSQERPYICEIESCRKTFAWLQSLRRHERLHAKRKAKFPCKLCSRLFTTRSALSDHLTRNHECNQCSDLFKTKEDLIVHQDFCTGSRKDHSEGMSRRRRETGECSKTRNF